MDESIVAEISSKGKKIIFVVTYRSQSQKVEDFHLFLDRLQLTLDHIKDIKPYSIVNKVILIVGQATGGQRILNFQKALL